MKIFFAVSSLSAGGAERVASTLCNAWVMHGSQVSLVPTFSGYNECFYHLDAKIKLIRLADFLPKKENSLIMQLRRLHMLRKLINIEKPDVIISFLTNVNVAVLIASINLRIPVIVCERSNPNQAPMSTALRLQSNIAYKWATRVIVQTQTSATFFQRKKRLKNIVIIPNPIPPDLPVQKVLHEYRTLANKHLMIAVGRLGPEKQFDLLINAFATLAETNATWDLCIIGEGPERKKLECLIEELNIKQRVHLPGRFDNPWEEMAKADAFILTSRFEGFPNALLEAMALGLPCISTDCPNGPREMSNDGQNVLLVPIDDRVCLLHSMQRVMNDAIFRENLGRKASESVIENYSLNKVLKIWDNLFVKVGIYK